MKVFIQIDMSDVLSEYANESIEPLKTLTEVLSKRLRIGRLLEAPSKFREDFARINAPATRPFRGFGKLIKAGDTVRRLADVVAYASRLRKYSLLQIFVPRLLGKTVYFFHNGAKRSQDMHKSRVLIRRATRIVERLDDVAYELNDRYDVAECVA